MSSTKDVYGIKKFDGSNFAVWKEQIQDVLVQKKQRLPILQNGRTKDSGLTQIRWNELDALARSTLRLHLAKSVYFTILECPIAYSVWLKLCSIYENNSASNKVFLMRKLYILKMKESSRVTAHLNEFDNLFAQICAQRMQIDDEMKAIHLLCSLPPSWDTFCIAISNSAPNGTLVYNDVSLAIIGEYIHCKSMSGKHGEAHYV